MAFSSTAAVDSGTKAQEGVFTNSLGNTYDLFYANHIPQVYRRYGKQFYDTLVFLQAMGRIEPTDSDTITLHEENWYHETIVNGGSPASFTSNTPTTMTIVSNTYPRVGVVIALDANAQYLGKITTVTNATTIVVQPVNSMGSGVTVAAGQTLPILMNQWADGSGQPDPALSLYSKTTFSPQIVKETTSINGRELVLGTWFDNHSTFWSEALLQGEYRQSLAIGNVMLLGQNTSNTTLIAAGDVTTKGLIPTIQSRGGEMTYTTGSFDLTSLHDIELYMIQNGVTNNMVCTLGGANWVKEFNDAVKSFVSNSKFITEGMTGQLSDVFNNINPEDRTEDGLARMGLDFNFKVAQIYNLTTIVKTENAFANPKTLGATGMNFLGSAIMFPLTNISDAKNPNMKLSNLAIRPLAKGGYSRFMETWKIGAAGGDNSTYVTANDKLDAYWRSDFMVQIAGANQMVYVSAA